MVRTKKWKYIYRHSTGPHELYNLVDDTDERNNLVDDPAYVELRAKLAERLKKRMAEAGESVPTISGSI